MAGKIINKVQWPASATANNVSSYTATGDSTNKIFISSSSAGSPAHLVDSNAGTNEFSNCTIQDMHVSGGTWQALTSSGNANVSGNEGWYFDLLTVASLAMNQAVGSILLAQIHNLAVAGILQSLSEGEITLTQAHNVTVNGLSQVLLSETISLTQAHSLIVAGLSQALLSGDVNLTQTHNLAVAGIEQALSEGEIALTQAHILVVNDLLQELLSGNVTLSQVHNLIVEGLGQSLDLDDVTLTQLHNIAVAVLSQGLSVGNIILEYIPGAGFDTALVVNGLQVLLFTDAVYLLTSLMVADPDHTIHVPAGADSIGIEAGITELYAPHITKASLP